MKQILCFIIALFVPFGLNAAQPDWSAYHRLLQKYVGPKTVSGINLNVIDYQALFKDPGFQDVIETVERFPIASLATREEQLSFYINAYNIFAIKVVRDNWPLESIKDAGSWFSPVWNKVAGRLNGKEISLGEIEHKILRPMGEPRIHFAIVCASLSCPDLRSEPFVAERLEAQLQDQTVVFLNNPDKGVRLNRNTAEVSQIFAWFEEDFMASGGVKTFIQSYLPDMTIESIDADLNYNWSLNGW